MANQERCPVHHCVVTAPIPGMWDVTGHADCPHCQKAPSPSVELKIADQAKKLEGTTAGQLKDSADQVAKLEAEKDDLKIQLEAKTKEASDFAQENQRLRDHIAQLGGQNA